MPDSAHEHIKQHFVNALYTDMSIADNMDKYIMSPGVLSGAQVMIADDNTDKHNEEMNIINR